MSDNTGPETSLQPYLKPFDRKSGKFPPISDEDRAIVHERMDQLSRQRERVVTAHCLRLDRQAELCARMVMQRKMTLAELRARFDALASIYEHNVTPPHLVIPYKEAIARLNAKFTEVVCGG